MEAIGALYGAGLIKSGEALTLSEGYLFLRKMGNLLSLFNDRSKNEITQGDFDRMAPEFGGSGGEGGFLRSEYARVTGDIRGVYNKYFLENS